MDDFETSLVPFARALDTIPSSTFDANGSDTIEPSSSGSQSDNTRSPKTTFPANGSLLDWHVLAIASLASKLTYDPFGSTIRLQNVVENIYCLPTIGHGASFTVKAHDASKFSMADKRRLDDLGVSGIVLKRLRHQSSSTSDDANRLAAILFELRVLTHKPLHTHQNIVKFIGLLWEGDPLGRDLLWPILLMERAEYGSLVQFQQRRFTLRYQTKRDLCADVAAGLDALHVCGIVHGDVKNENILIFGHRDRGFIAKVADFGCAVLEQRELDERTTALGGTPPWNAPEFRDSKLARASIKATDVYSYGFVVWRVMIDGRDPFESFHFDNVGKLATIAAWKEQDELVEKAIWSLASQPESDVLAEEVCSILEATLQAVPSKRDLKHVLQTFDREAALPSAGDDESSTQSLQRIEFEMEHMLETFKLKDFDHLFQRQYIRALQYSLRLYQSNAEFSEHAKCALLRCFLTGVGGEPSIDSALEVLVDICTHDDEVVLRHAEMILLFARLCEAHGKPVPDHLPLNDWLWCNAMFGSRHAHDILSTRDPELAASAFKTSRTKIFGVGHEVQDTIKQLLKEPTFLTDALDPAGNSSNSFVFPETSNMDTPLHCAAMADELEAVRALVDRTGADVNALNVLQETPLLQACRAGHFDVACFLLSRGADPTIYSTSHGESCLHFLSSFQEEWQMKLITKECLERGADLEAFAAGPQGGMFSYESPESGSPLHWAVCSGNLAVVRTLCDAGADIFNEYASARGFGRDPVYVAANRVYVDILRYFLQDRRVLELSRSCVATYSKVDALLRCLVMGSVSDPISDKLLRRSGCVDSFAEAMSLLKEADVPFDRADAGDLLFFVIRTGDAERLEVLLKNGCPVDALSGEEETLLQYCIATCDKAMFDLALAYGADVMRQTSKGGCYLDLCVTHYHHDTYFAEELLKRGVYVDGPTGAGQSPFRKAVKLGCFELATLFLRYGADKEALVSKMTVLGELAVAGSDYPVVSLQFLLEPPHKFGASSFLTSPEPQLSVLQLAVTKFEAGRDSNGNMAHLAYILERFPSPEHLNFAGDGIAPLHQAVQSCFPEGVQLLLEAGADPNILNWEHRAALDMAVDMAEKADPSLPGFPEEICEAGDKSVAQHIARRWRLVETLVSFGAMLSADLPTAGLAAARLVNCELQPLLEDRGHMCYADALPTLEEWTKCLRPVMENHLEGIVVTSPSLTRSLSEFAEAICEVIRPYYLKIYIERDDEGVSLVFGGIDGDEAEEVETELVQALSA